MAEISTIARPYAVAAYKLGKEQKALAKWSEMLGFATQVANDTKMQAYINDPKVVASDLQACRPQRPAWPPALGRESSRKQLVQRTQRRQGK